MSAGVLLSVQPWHENCPAPVETEMVQSVTPLTPREVPVTSTLPAALHDDGLFGATRYKFWVW
jgi:hypothetical protein